MVGFDCAGTFGYWQFVFDLMCAVGLGLPERFVWVVRCAFRGLLVVLGL